MSVSQEKIDPASDRKLELLDLQTLTLGHKSDSAARKTLEMGAMEPASVVDELTAQLRRSNLGATIRVTSNSGLRTPPEEERFMQIADEPTPGPEMSIFTTTPPASEKGPSPTGSPLNPDAKEHVCKGAMEPLYIEEPRDTVRHMMWLYSSQLAKECKGQCPLVKNGKCKCQSSADKVLSDLDILSGENPLDEDENIWYRFVANMNAMLSYFWSKHGVEKTPRDFDLGYYGFKLLQAFTKDEFKMERAIFESIFEAQFRAPLEEILAEEMMLYYSRVEQMLAGNTGYPVL